MKVFIHYEEPADESYHKTSKISLPKKWVNGPCSAVVKLFVDSYNKNAMEAIPLEDVHLETAGGHALANDSTVSDYLEAGADVYIKTGAAPASDADVTAPKVGAGGAAGGSASAGGGGGAAALPTPPRSAAATPATASKPAAAGGGGGEKQLQCMRFGCQKKYFESENHEAACRYHRLPPVFHETAKFWACCPDKKCYDWDSFMAVKGCMTACHTIEKPDQSGKSLGGGDVRSGNTDASAPKLKSIDEFNAQKASGGGGAGDAIAKMYQLRQAMDKAGISGELFDRAKEAVSARVGGDHETIHSEVVARLTACLKAMEQE